jgi:acetate kinase
VRALTVNVGSTSLKLEAYDLGGPLPPLADPPDPAFAAEPEIDGAEHALRPVLEGAVDIVAHRFVRLPDDAPAVMRLDAPALAAIKAVGKDDPLHDAAALDVVDLIARLRPGVAQVAVSDSAFHRTMPPAATTYALPRAVVGEHLHRIGYHGLSHEYAAARGCKLAGLDVTRARVITAHLGGGSSLCAVRSGESIDTTMGYTPLEGLPMATRSGSVDPGLLIHLMRGGMSLDTLEDMLERRSGLLGISGFSKDVRELLAAPGNAAAYLALDVLAWRLRASLGAMAATLGGVDLIVFTGGIGEHAPAVRSAGLEGGLGFGARIDEQRNAASAEGAIAAPASTVAIVIVAAREGWQLARAASNGLR